MGKKSKRNNKKSSGANRRQLIQARRATPLEPREEADQLREKVVYLMQNHGSKAQCHDVMTEYAAFIVTEAQKTDHYFATNEDVKFLKSIFRNQENYPCLRAAAISVWGKIALGSLLLQFTQSQQVCLQLCNQVLASEIQNDMYISNLKSLAIEALDREMETTLSWTNAEGREIQVGYFGGLNCDFCGAWVKDYAVDFLQCCGRCKMAYYCSQQCQKKDWKCRHKSFCRKRGEFHLGDTVLYDQTSNKTKIGPIETMHVLASLNCTNKKGKPLKYLVFCLSRQVCVPVPTEHLFRMRPAVWVESFCAPKAKAMELIKLRGSQN